MNYNSPSQSQHSPQMQGQMFTAAEAFYTTAKQVTPLIKTPYTALAIDQQMLKPLLKLVKPFYEIAKNHLIPLCHYGNGLEPPSVLPDVKALAAVDDRNGLQIILCAVDGKKIRKDGIPYHMIWSYDPSLPDFPVADNHYTWPVVELDDPQVVLNERGLISIVFQKQVKMDLPYRRVLGNIEKQAEELASMAYRQSNEGCCMGLFKTSEFDYHGLGMPLKILSPDGATAKTPEPVRVDHDATNRRMACPGVWYG